MNPKTPLEVFAKVVKHQRKQKKKCLNPDKTTMDGKYCCSYGNLRDPVGVVISKSFLNILERLHGATVWENHVKALLLIEGFPQQSISLLYKLTKIHDLCKVKTWEDEWQQLSVELDLPLPEKGGQEVFPFMGHMVK